MNYILSRVGVTVDFLFGKYLITDWIEGGALVIIFFCEVFSSWELLPGSGIILLPLSTFLLLSMPTGFTKSLFVFCGPHICWNLPMASQLVSLLWLLPKCKMWFMESSGLWSWRLPLLHSDCMNLWCAASDIAFNGLSVVSLLARKCLRTDWARFTCGPYAPPIEVTLRSCLPAPATFFLWNCFLPGIISSSSLHCLFFILKNVLIPPNGSSTVAAFSENKVLAFFKQVCDRPPFVFCSFGVCCYFWFIFWSSCKLENMSDLTRII